MPIPPPPINVIFHTAVFLMSLLALIVGLALWYNRTINHLGVSSYWRIFMAGIFFYTVSEFSDIFTPGLSASLGVHNLITEMTLLVGLGLIFVSLFHFMQDYVRKYGK